MFYPIKMPWLIRIFFSKCIWDIKTTEKILYLTFDDGPHVEATEFILNELKKYNAKGTFFCIGKNVKSHPEIFEKILHDDHVVANHTYDHLNGWKANDDVYIQNIKDAQNLIHSRLFRPPYGRIKISQLKKLLKSPLNFKVIMWSILSGDFDVNITGEKCAKNVINNARSGSVVVFHDSEKALERMRYALPKVLEHFHQKGYAFKAIDV